MSNRKVILASASPRRRELLKLLFDQFEVIPSGAEEEISAEDPEELVKELSRRKAEWVAEREPDAVVIGADTMVFLGNEPLGKPRDAEDAARMLRSLSGRRHRVVTGVTVCSPQETITEAASTEVVFAELSEEEIGAYLATGESLDKAGAYGIQGYAARFVKKIDGCYFNVVGLPVQLLYQMLRRLDEK